MVMPKYGRNSSYDEGARAFQERQSYTDNPHERGTQDYNNWQEGFMDELRREQPDKPRQ